MDRLRDTSSRFQQELSQEIESYLLKAATNGRKYTRFQSKFSFSESYGNVKVSTLVYGWRVGKGVFTVDSFKDIQLESTPFNALVKSFADRNITVSNISNPSKGFGFWIEASF
jgi:hypothetical protein